MSNQNILIALKGAAWQRAKGELLSIGYMDFPPTGVSHKDWDTWNDHGDRRREVIDAFIKTMDEEELYL